MLVLAPGRLRAPGYAEVTLKVKLVVRQVLSELQFPRLVLSKSLSEVLGSASDDSQWFTSEESPDEALLESPNDSGEALSGSLGESSAKSLSNS